MKIEENEVYSPFDVLQYNLDCANAEIKKLRTKVNDLNKSLREEKARCKKKVAELTYHKGLLYDAERQKEVLKKRIEKERKEHKQELERNKQMLKQVVEQGYVQDVNFNPEHSGIYRIYNKTTLESYVGQSRTNVLARCLSHYKYKTKKDDWHYDLQHNPQNYEYEILVEGVPDQYTLNRLEVYNIGKYDCIEHGYNKVIAARNKFLLPLLKYQNKDNS